MIGKVDHYRIRIIEFGKRYEQGIMTAVMTLLPLLCCFLHCAFRGHGISDVSIAAGEWNDELFYFKQVEGIVHYGYPQGYFGFNESHALKLSFAAWSPVLVFPWILWGLLFGWNLSSPVYCNIFLMMLAMFVFMRLVKPSRKQAGILALLFVTFTPLTRYMLSCMPECICFAMAIITFSLAVSYHKKARNGKLAGMFVLGALMTLMRPYLLLFLLYPAYQWICRKKVWGVIGSAGIVGATGVIYVLINHYLSAAYFTPLFDVTWITTFLEKGIVAGIKFMGYQIIYRGLEYFGLMLQGIRTNLFWGEYFAAFTVMMFVVLVYAIKALWKKHSEKILFCYAALWFVGMWTALILMYKMKEGSKHLLTFLAVGIFVVCLMETKRFIKPAILAMVFAALFLFTGVDSYEHQVPFTSTELEERSAYWQEVFKEECQLEREEVPNFDNVMIWVFNDKVGEEFPLTPYQMLYELPEGMGISCCYADYVKENLPKLQSKYLAVVSGGEVDMLCKQQELREIGRDEGLVVYELH